MARPQCYRTLDNKILQGVDEFGFIWNKLNPWVGPSLGPQIGPQLIFPPKWCHVNVASICHFLVLDRHLNAVGPIYASQSIGLLYFIAPLTLDLHVKSPLRPTLDGEGFRVQILRNQFGLIWCKLNPWVLPHLQT